MQPNSTIPSSNLRSPAEYVNGVVTGALVSLAGVGACYILSRCSSWYRDPTCRPCWWWRRHRREEEPATEDMASLTRRLATIPDSRRWMATYQYFIEMHPRLPQVQDLRPHEPSSQQSLLTSPGVPRRQHVFRSASTVAVDGEELIPLQQAGANTEVYSYLKTLRDISEVYDGSAKGSFDVDERYYRWLVGATNLAQERRRNWAERNAGAEAGETRSLPQTVHSSPASRRTSV